jgi:ribosomal protein L23
MNEPVKVLKEALLTEKATMLSANLNQYVFSVFPEATRTHVKNAI